MASITLPSFTSFKAVGSTAYCFPAELVAICEIAAEVQATPSISKVIAAVPVVVALLCANTFTILPLSGTTTNVEDADYTSGIAEVIK